MLDEELPQPPERSALRSRLLLAGAILVGLALVVAVTARLATRSTPQAAPTVTVSPSGRSGPSVTAGPTTTFRPAVTRPPGALHVLRSLSAREIAAAHAHCPRLAVTCTTTGEAPVAVRAALAAVFPGVGRLVAVSDIAYRTNGGPRLVFRQLSAHAGDLTIAVEVRQPQPGEGVGTQNPAADAGVGYVARYQAVVDDLIVEVQVTAPSEHALDTERIAELGSDARLLGTG